MRDLREKRKYVDSYGVKCACTHTLPHAHMHTHAHTHVHIYTIMKKPTRTWIGRSKEKLKVLGHT